MSQTCGCGCGHEVATAEVASGVITPGDTIDMVVKRVPGAVTVLRELGISDAEAKTASFKEGKGCVDCNNTGYRGRLGVYEVMPVTPKVRDLILDRAPTNQIKKAAVAEGMLTLRADGLVKLKNGVTTAEEVLKETAADR